MATVYDLVLMLDPNVPDDRHREILGSVNSAIEGKGTLVGQHDWGMRRMAFEIDHRPDAAYHLFQFEGSKDLLDQLHNSLKIADGVLRHRIIKVKPGTPPPVSPRPEPPRGARPVDDPGGAVAARAAADAPPREQAVEGAEEPAPAAAEAAPAPDAGAEPASEQA
jgi:small subunit ribosomal protein S6